MTEPKGEFDDEVEMDEVDNNRLIIQRKRSILSPIKGISEEF